MAELTCFLEHFKKYNPKFLSLLKELTAIESQCLLDSKQKIAKGGEISQEKEAEILGFCSKDRETFNKILAYESQQFINVFFQLLPIYKRKFGLERNRNM